MTNDPLAADDDVALPAARALNDRALDTIFREARSANGFLPGAVPRELLKRVVELAELGPTSSNSLPVRYVFVESGAAKERLEPALSPGNAAKTMQAPVTAIVAADLFFYERFAITAPSRPTIGDRFSGPDKIDMVRTFARDNALLQMGYFIIAARALGLGCGPMGGFDKSAVDRTFFPDGRLLSLYLINLGHDDGTPRVPRSPRLRAEEIASFV